ncbi:two-component sensor histidine kinase [Acinetobacter sp. LoGeW2-3]|uniref:sensor histidine kinase n=1 Tax=Acinetobacter sp. LoGeW2-3 TaxID=1808001 RepID=UPI000C0590A4|nr:ATP-binding protein [Acinetobacter sp. LoGeW2-3]ATO20062.1 two-component sensor histidine kinase [Acinetobacter sp. LoGeW2-3]
MAQVISLQYKLIKNAMYSSILAGCLAWLLLLGISGYQSMQMHDELMEEISELLLGDVTQAQGRNVDEISEEFDIQYRLWLDQDLLTTSEKQDLLQHQLRHSSGIHFQFEHGQLLRTLVAEDEGLKVQVIQPVSIRFKRIWNIILGFAVILILLWLVQWLLLHLLIKRQLMPLNRISQDIASKSAQDLSPVQSPTPEIAELQPIISQLNRMLGRVEQSLTAEQRFTADASHELRSPLSAIQMRLQVLKRKYQAHETLPQDLMQIQKDVSRGTQILENLLLLARLDPEQNQNLPLQKVNLPELIQDALKTLAPFVEEKQLNLKLELNPADISGNAELIFSCLRNLIDNAIKYTPSTGTVLIQCDHQGNKAEIVIENSGEGISEETLQRLGERFYRALGTKTQGSGLGLSICQKIMQLHQGEIQFTHSELGGLKVVLIFDQNY